MMGEEENQKKEELPRENFNSSGESTRTIPVIEESIQIDKKTIEKGTVQIIKRIEEEDVTLDVPIMKEQVHVDRVSINQFVDTSPSVRHEGDTIIIPVVKEVIVKRLFLSEEIRVSKKETTEQQEFKTTIRREKVDVVRENLRNEKL